jgi:hypothetical protein
MISGDAYGGAIGQRTTVTTYVPPQATRIEDAVDVAGANVLARWTGRTTRNSHSRFGHFDQLGEIAGRVSGGSQG